MSAALKIAGQKFNRLTAWARVWTNEDNKVVWFFDCECGGIEIATAKDVVNGHIKSCGCLLSEKTATRNRENKTHGMKSTPEYQAWASMKNRCSNRKDRVFLDYGARGISVCARWTGENGFQNFFADMGPRPIGFTKTGRPEYSLDRWPNNDGNYEPSNCRWATYKEQNKNRRRFRAVEKFSIEELQAALSKKLKGQNV